jgi:hypothetical protein
VQRRGLHGHLPLTHRVQSHGTSSQFGHEDIFFEELRFSVMNQSQLKIADDGKFPCTEAQQNNTIAMDVRV